MEDYEILNVDKYFNRMIVEYAQKKGCSITEAIRELLWEGLVNSPELESSQTRIDAIQNSKR